MRCCHTVISTINTTRELTKERQWQRAKCPLSQYCYNDSYTTLYHCSRPCTLTCLGRYKVKDSFFIGSRPEECEWGCLLSERWNREVRRRGRRLLVTEIVVHSLTNWTVISSYFTHFVCEIGLFVYRCSSRYSYIPGHTLHHHSHSTLLLPHALSV